MWTILMGIFFVLHGLVHLLYAGQSRRLFELRPGMTWPDGSWAFSKLLSDETTRLLATALLALATLVFLVGGLGLFIRQGWWRPVALAAAVFSTLIFILFWDGRFQALDDKGGVGLLINLAILGVVLILKFPA
jgi:hypothetical protein